MAHVAVRLDERAGRGGLEPLAREELSLAALTLDGTLARLVRCLPAQTLSSSASPRCSRCDRRSRPWPPDWAPRSRSWSRWTARRSRPYRDAEPGEFFYQRYGSPTVAAAEASLGELEGGHALLFPSGAGATTARRVMSCSSGAKGRRRSGCLLRDDRHAGRARAVGLEHVLFDQTGPPPDGVDLVWVESPSNPLLTLPTISTPRSRTRRPSSSTPPRRPCLPEAARAGRRVLAPQRDQVPRRAPRRPARRRRLPVRGGRRGAAGPARTARDRCGAGPLAVATQPEDPARTDGAPYGDRDRAGSPAEGPRRRRPRALPRLRRADVVRRRRRRRGGEGGRDGRARDRERHLSRRHADDARDTLALGTGTRAARPGPPKRRAPRMSKSSGRT